MKIVTKADSKYHEPFDKSFIHAQKHGKMLRTVY